MAGLIFNGTTMSDSLDARQKKPSFAPQLTRLQPGGVAPLFLLLSKIGSGTALQVKHGFWTETLPFVSLKITADVTAAATSIAVTDSSQTIPGQIYQYPKTGENILVTAVADGTHVTVRRAFGNVAAGVMTAADNVSLYHVGNAYEEASGRPQSQRLQQSYIDNYTQIFRTGWSISGTAMSEEFYQEAGGNPMGKDKTDAALLHMMDVERNLIFGQKYMNVLNGRPIHTMDGIIALLNQYAPSHVTAAAATTNYDQLETALEPCFDTVIAGTTNERIGFTGSAGLKVVNGIGRLSGEYQLLDNQTIFGMQFKSFRTTRGIFHLMEHPIFNSNPVWSSMLLAMDLTQLRVMYLAGRKSQHKYWGANGELATDNSIDAVGGVITSELTLESRNPGACALITGLTKAAA